MKYATLLSLVFLLAACSAKLYTPIQADVDRVMDKYPGYSLAELQEGKSIFEMNCGACHPLKKPTSRTPEQWEKIVPRMVQNVNRKAKKELISKEKQELVLKYLVARTRAGAAAKK